jgi:hypothetical protein
MVRTAIRDIEAIRAALPLDQRHHSEIVLRHLNQALSDMTAPAAPKTGVVVRLDLVAARRARRAPRTHPATRAER